MSLRLPKKTIEKNKLSLIICTADEQQIYVLSSPSMTDLSNETKHSLMQHRSVKFPIMIQAIIKMYSPIDLNHLGNTAFYLFITILYI